MPNYIYLVSLSPSRSQPCVYRNRGPQQYVTSFLLFSDDYKSLSWIPFLEIPWGYLKAVPVSVRDPSSKRSLLCKIKINIKEFCLFDCKPQQPDYQIVYCYNENISCKFYVLYLAYNQKWVDTYLQIWSKFFY